MTGVFPGKFQCLREGYYRDPDDCSKFYRCTESTQHYFSCPDGLLFNEDKLSCDFATSVDCNPIGKPKQTRVEIAPDELDYDMYPLGDKGSLTEEEKTDSTSREVVGSLAKQGNERREEEVPTARSRNMFGRNNLPAAGSFRLSETKSQVREIRPSKKRLQ